MDIYDAMSRNPATVKAANSGGFTGQAFRAAFPHGPGNLLFGRSPAPEPKPGTPEHDRYLMDVVSNFVMPLSVAKNAGGFIGGGKHGVDALKQSWAERGIKSFVNEGKDSIRLDKIIVPKGSRSQGMGTEAMQELIDYADSTGKQIELSPSADFGGSKARLKNFYKRFGFVENKGANKDLSISESMYRPNVASSEARGKGFLPKEDIEKLNDAKRLFSEGMDDEAFEALPETGFYRARAEDAPVESEWGHSMYVEGVPEEVWPYYGNNLYSINPSKGMYPEVESLKKNILKAYAEDYKAGTLPDDFTDYGITGKNILESVNPENIVDSAGGWDSSPITQWMYERVIKPNGISGVKTYNGLISFKPKDAIRLKGLIGTGAGAGGGEARSEGFLPMDSPERAENFKRWFGDSKVVDDAGEPLTVYHGTGQDFDAFDMDSLGSVTEHPTARLGTYFTENPKTADIYARDNSGVVFGVGDNYRDGASIVPVNLSLKKPYEISAEEFRNVLPVSSTYDEAYGFMKTPEQMDAFVDDLKKEGYDGIRIIADDLKGRPASQGLEEFAKDQYIVFDPTQIKSATGNRGTYSPTDPNIMHGLVGPGLATGAATIPLLDEDTRKGFLR
jgi:predicted GNAT family acetyltransferase